MLYQAELPDEYVDRTGFEPATLLSYDNPDQSARSTGQAGVAKYMVPCRRVGADGVGVTGDNPTAPARMGYVQLVHNAQLVNWSARLDAPPRRADTEG